MAGWLFLLIALAGTMIVINAAKPRRGTFSLVPSWLLAFLTLDLAPFHIALALVFAGLFTLGGALESFPGKLALLLTFASSAVLFVLWLPSLRAASVADAVASELELDAVEPLPRRLLLNPVPRLREGVAVTRNVPFSRRDGRGLKMDIYRGTGDGAHTPPHTHTREQITILPIYDGEIERVRERERVIIK